MKKFNKVHLFIGFLALVIITIFCFSTKDKQSTDKYAQYTLNAKRTISWLKKHPGYSEKHEKQVDKLIKTYPDFGVYNISLAASFAGFDGE